MQNEELINQLQSLIETTQYLKKGSVLSFDNNQVQVRLSDFTTITTKNLGVTKLGDCLVVTAEDGVYAIQESRENNKGIVNIINRRVNRQSRESIKEKPEAHYILCQIEKGNLTSEAPSKFIRVDRELEQLTKPSFDGPSYVFPGPFKRRYCIETVDPIGVDACDSDVVFNTLEECLINDPTEDENDGTPDNPQSEFIPGGLGTVTLSFFASFDSQEYADYVVAYDLETTFPNMSPFTCDKRFHYGLPFGEGGFPIIISLGTLVAESISSIPYADSWVKTYWSNEQLESIYPDGFNGGMAYHLRDWVADVGEESSSANIWYNWPFEFAYRHSNMGSFTVRSWGGFQINCQQNRVDTIVGFMQSNGWVLDTFNCSSSGELDGPPEGQIVPEKEASHHIPLSSEYVVKFYLCNSRKTEAIYLHEMSIDDYFCYYVIGPYSFLNDVFSKEIEYKYYVRDSNGKTWNISEPLLKYFNNQYKSIIEMYLEDAQREDYFSFSKLDTNIQILNEGGISYSALHNRRNDSSGSYYYLSLFCTNQRITDHYPHAGDSDSTHLGVNRITTENYHKLKIFHKSKKEVLILINEGLVSKNFQEYEYLKTHLILIKNQKIVNKITYTHPNINEEEIQTIIDEYSFNVLLKDYYVYRKTLYRIDYLDEEGRSGYISYSNEARALSSRNISLFSQYESIDTNGLPNFYDLTTYSLFSNRDARKNFLRPTIDDDFSFNYRIYQRILNNEIDDSVFWFKADKILYRNFSHNVYKLYYNNNYIEIGLDTEHGSYDYYNFEGSLIQTRHYENSTPLSFMGTYEVFDSFYDGKYLTRLWKSYRVQNYAAVANRDFITEKAFFDYYQTDSFTDLITRFPEFKSTVDIDDMLVPLLFQNQREIELTFRKSKPFYSTVRKDVPLLPVEYVGSPPNLYSFNPKLKQRYNIAKTKPPIFLNEDNKSIDIKIKIRLPTNIPKTTQLQKKSCRVLSMQLIP